MAAFVHQHGRRRVFFTDHALDRWWERQRDNGLHGRQAAMNLLRERLDSAAQEPRRTYQRDIPPWSRLSLWHRARADGFLTLGDDACFVINRNRGGDYVAVTYIERTQPHDASA